MIEVLFSATICSVHISTIYILSPYIICKWDRLHESFVGFLLLATLSSSDIPGAAYGPLQIKNG